MNANLVIRARTAKNENLATQSLNRALSALSGSDLDRLRLPGYNVKVRLAPFEIFLLNRCVEQYASDDGGHIADTPEARFDQLTQLVFYRWSWAHDVLHQLLADLDPFDVSEDHAGSQQEAFEMATTLLRRKYIREEDSDKRSRRVEAFILDNSQFTTQLGNVDHGNINVLLDNACISQFRSVTKFLLGQWDTISCWPGFSAVDEMISGGNESNSDTDSNDGTEGPINLNALGDNGGDADAGSNLQTDDVVMNDSADATTSTETVLEDEITQGDVDDLDERLSSYANRKVDELLKIENTWEVWRFARMLRIIYERPDNENLLRQFFSSSWFCEHWREVRVAVDDDEEEGGAYHGFLPVQQYEEERLCEDEIMDFFENNSLTHTSLEYIKRTRNRALPDPSHYLEVIPWQELQDTGNEVNVQAIALKTWTSNSSGINSRIFYVNEDASSAFLSEEFFMPEVLEPRTIVLICRRLQDTKFCSSLRDFWGVWNDCAISVRPEDGEIFLVESFSGAKFRQVYESIGWNAAVRSLSTSIRRLKNGYDGHNSIRQLLGPEYDSSFEYLLDYISPNDLSNLETYGIGQGSFGRVYRAKWSKHPPISDPEADPENWVEGEVALKVSLVHHTVQGYQKFVQELRTLNAALANDLGGCIRFFGITQVWIDSRHSISLERSEYSNAVPALVFDFATEGTAFSFLERQVCSDNYSSNWGFIFSALNGLSWGLKSIHEQDIIHRDIHPNNILVAKEYFANSNSTDYHFLLSDLGEGKRITDIPSNMPLASTTTNMPQSFGIEHYRAPEIHGAEGFSKASDMYAFGQFGKDIIKRHSASLQENDCKVLRLPAKLVHVLESCTSDDPDDRYEAALVGYMLDQVESDFSDGKAELVDAGEIHNNTVGLLDWKGMSKSLNYSVEDFL